jgi:chromosomal replication initiator protein
MLRPGRLTAPENTVVSGPPAGSRVEGIIPVDNLLKTWDAVLTAVQEDLKNERAFDSWFKPLRLLRMDEGRLFIQLPNPMAYKGILPFLDTLRGCLARTLGYEPVIEWQFAGTELAAAAGIPKALPARTQETPSENLNQAYTFDNFVVGPCNRFAHAAGLAIAQAPGTAYNPLFLYGGVGLGKTHLMQAIGHMAKIRGNCQVSYLTCEVFVNQFIYSIQNKTTHLFRNRFRSVDVLLIDDIHFLAGKEGTQEEFFHTFNSLYDQKKQIVLSSDRPPKEISALEKRLVSRFEWGLVVDLMPPDFETRVAILKKKCETRGIPLDDDVVFYIAENISDNIRLLEGALNRLVAFSSLSDTALTLDVAKDYLKELFDSQRKMITIEKIQETVAEFFKLSLYDLKSQRRLKNLVIPRQIAMYLARTLTDYSLTAIADEFGGKDHTTVLHACKKIKACMETDSYFKNTIEKIINSLKE